MNEHASVDHGGQKRRSFTEALTTFAPIVPLPGDAPRASVTAVPDALDDDLPPVTGPQPIPLPPHLRTAVVPRDASPAPVHTAPEGPDDDLSSGQSFPPIDIPSHPFASHSLPSQAVPEPQAERTAEVPARPEPMDDAAFRRALAPPSLSDMPGQAATAAAGYTRPRRRRAWPWVALLVLGAAGAAAVWVQRAPEPQSVQPAAGLALPAPAGAASSPEAAPASSPPVDTAAEPASPSAPQTLSEPALKPIPEPTPAPAPPAAIAAEPVLPSPPQAASEPALEPTSEPAPGAPDLRAPEPDAVAAEPPPAALPTPDAEPAAADSQPPLPIPPVPVPPLPIPPVPTLAPPDRRVVIYRRPASSAAEAEAGRLAAKLRPFAAQVETRTAAAISRLPTLRYFHAEDAAAAQELAAALRRPDAVWRVQAMLNQAPLLPPHSFQVWLPDR